MHGPPPPPPRIDFGLDEVTDEDEFFGIPVPGEPGPLAGAPAENAVSRATGKLFAPVAALANRRRQHQRDEQLEALAELSSQVQPMQAVDTLDPELEGHMIRLRDSRALQDYYSAEAQTPLFVNYERTRERELASSSWALRIAALIFLIVGALAGQDYAHDLLRADVPVAEVLVTNLGVETARAVTFCSGAVGPLLAFLLLCSSLEDVIAGARAARWVRVGVGVAGCVVTYLCLGALGAGSYFGGALACLGGWVALRAVQVFMRAVSR